MSERTKLQEAHEAIDEITTCSDKCGTLVGKKDAHAALDAAVEEATISGVNACLRHRCVKHYRVAQINTSEASGAECGACIVEAEKARAEAAERDRDDARVLIALETSKRLDSERERDEARKVLNEHGLLGGT